MPSKSEKQHRFMSATAHNIKFAARNKIPQSVAKKYIMADKKYGKFKKKGK